MSAFLPCILALLLLSSFRNLVSGITHRSLQTNDDTTNKNKNSNNQRREYPSAITGFYKGSYFDQHDDNPVDNGTCLLMIDHVVSIHIDNYDDKLAEFETNQIYKTQNSSILRIQSSLAKTRLSFLNTAAFKRDIHLFWFGVYDQYNGRIVLSTYNFSYFVWNQSISIHSINKNDSIHPIRMCPETLSIQISAADDQIIGNFSNCKHNITVFDLSFVEKDTFYHQSNTYGICSLIAVSATFYLLFKQYEFSNMMGRVIKVCVAIILPH